MNKKLALFYFMFSLLYCFVLIDRSYFNLSGDNLNIASMIYPSAYPGEYAEGPIKTCIGLYYLPSFLAPAAYILKKTCSYILTLQIILFFQLFLTLLSTSYMISVMFKGIGLFRNAFFTLLLNMAVVYLPSGEIAGFGTLQTALPRYFCGIFIPLLLAFYYRYDEVKIYKLRIPSIVPIGFFSGLLVNIHPPSSIIFFIILSVHWFVMRTGIFSSFRNTLLKVILTGVSALFLFSICAIFYVLPYIHYSYNQPSSVERILPDGAQQPASEVQMPVKSPSEKKLLAFVKKKIASSLLDFRIKIKKYDRDLMFFFLRQLLFLPFIIPFFLLIFFRREISDAQPSGKKLFHFLSSLFLTGFAIDLTGMLICQYFSFGPYLVIFQRSDRFVFLLVELLALYYLFYGREISRGRREYYFFSAGILFFWVCISRSKGLMQYNFLSRFYPFSALGLEEQSVLICSVLAAAFFSLAALFKLRLLPERNFRRALLVFSFFLFFGWPLISGGIVIFISHALDTFNGIGAWKAMSVISGSKAHEKMSQFDAACGWARKNTPPLSRFLYFDKNKSQNMKVACIRNGIGGIDEIGTDGKLNDDICNLYKGEDEKPFEISRLANVYKLEYILVGREHKTGMLEESGLFSREYENKYYILFKKL